MRFTSARHGLSARMDTQHQDADVIHEEESSGTGKDTSEAQQGGPASCLSSPAPVKSNSLRMQMGRNYGQRCMSSATHLAVILLSLGILLFPCSCTPTPDAPVTTLSPTNVPPYVSLTTMLPFPPLQPITPYPPPYPPSPSIPPSPPSYPPSPSIPPSPPPQPSPPSPPQPPPQPSPYNCPQLTSNQTSLFSSKCTYVYPYIPALPGCQIQTTCNPCHVGSPPYVMNYSIPVSPPCVLLAVSFP